MMKKTLLKITAIFICTICVLAQVSCSRTDYPIVTRGSDGKVTGYMTKGIFSFFLSQKKANYLTVLSFNDSTITQDSEDVWNTVSNNGRPYGEVFFDEIVNEAQDMMSAQYILFDVCGYELPTEYSTYIENLIMQNAIDKYGSVSAFENYLANFGTSYEDYKNLYFMTTNVDLLKELLYNEETGILRFSEQEKQAYFADNYYTIKHVYVNTTYTDKMDGTKAPLTESEQARRVQTAEKIALDLRSGMDFSQIAEQYNVENSYVSVYDAEMYIDKNAGTSVKELGEAVSTMAVGEVRTVNSDYGIHIIRRFETDAADYSADETIPATIAASLADMDYPLEIEKFRKNVSINEQVLAEFDIVTALMP